MFFLLVMCPWLVDMFPLDSILCLQVFGWLYLSGSDVPAFLVIPLFRKPRFPAPLWLVFSILLPLWAVQSLQGPCPDIYIYRAEAGGSPEANCNLIVWIWKMLILYCVLQCFLPSLESVPSVKVSMSARINSEFVRAEK